MNGGAVGPRGFRSATAAQTFARFAHLQEQAGITRLANLTGLDAIGLEVFAAIRPNSKSLAVSLGKGIDREAARTSALMEALECWHAEEFVPPPVRMGSYQALQAREPTVRLEPYAKQVDFGNPLAEKVEWITGIDLRSGNGLLVPRDLVRLDFRPTEVRGEFPQSTNGLASGNSREEAVLHGLFELIERDAVTLWFSADGAPERRVAKASVPGRVATLVRAATDAGLEVGLYNATSDVDVPVYMCLVADGPGLFPRMGHFWGSACHLSPEIALQGAICEALQCRMAEISGTRDDIIPETYAAYRDEETVQETLRMLQSNLDEEPFERRENETFLTCEAALDVTLRRLEPAASEVVCVDLSCPALGVPVIKVLAPALEGVPLEHVPGDRARRVGGA